MDIQFYGKVIHGDHVGRTLGFPTANLDIDSKEITLPHGIYAGTVTIQNKNISKHPAAIVIRPWKKTSRLEVHLLDFDQAIYGENLVITISKHIRDWKDFKDTESLKKQIVQDIASLRDHLLLTNNGKLFS